MRTRILLHVGLLSAAPLAAQNLPSFYWRLDEIAGAVAHDDVGGSNGQLQGAATWQPTAGHFSGALRCYGNDARVELGPCDLTGGPGDEFTIACWFRPEIVAGTERILMAKTLGPNEEDFVWSLSLVNSTGARFRLRAGGTLHTVEIPPSSIFSNTWYHIAATYDGTNIRVFLNGSTTANGQASGAIGFHPQAPATLGNLYNSTLPFYGSLDDVRLYDHALNGLEVVDLVIGDVSTGVDEQRISVGTDGVLHLPNGSWNQLRVLDMSGRYLLGEPLNGGNTSAAMAQLSPGLYLVCLQGASGQLSRTVCLP
jgi:Concanavalin A-like lectin/glucanases superfamily